MGTKQEKLYRVIVLGAGDMAQHHVKAWRDTGRAEVAGVCDADAARLAAFQKKYEIAEGEGDWRKLIERLKPDVVSVCLPVFLHRPVTEFAAAQGCHVFCEKPIALTVDDAKAMVQTCAKKKVLLAIDFQRRYGEDTAFYRELIQNGDLGRPVVWQKFDVREVRPKILMHEREGNGGSIIDCAVHWFDLWRHIFKSEPKTVYARGGIFGKGKPRLAAVQNFAVDTGVITVGHESGDIGEITIGWGLPENTPGLGDEMILGPDGLIRASESGARAFRGRWVREWKASPGAWAAHPPLFKDFVAALDGEKPNPISGEDGLAALRVARAALESIETGQVVKL